MKKKKLETIFNTILVFKEGEMIRQLKYSTKKDTLTNYRGFVKNGILDYETFEPIAGATFELL